MTLQIKRLSPIKKIPEYYPGAFTEASIRWLIFNESSNGFSSCICRIGRKVLIDLDAFEAWINSQKNMRKHDNSLNSQRERLLAKLREQPVTTFEARTELDIVAPAPRIFELRHDGNYNIQTHWVDDINPVAGGSHRIARYVLRPGKWQGVLK